MLDYASGPSTTTRILGSGRGRRESQRRYDNRNEIRTVPLLALQVAASQGMRSASGSWKGRWILF